MTREGKVRIPCEIYNTGRRVDIPVEHAYQLCERCERAQGDHRSVAPTPIETDDTRYAAWTAFLAQWALTYPCRLAFRCEKESTDGGYYLRIAFDYPDERDARDGVTVMPAVCGLWPPSLWPDADTPRWIRSNLLYHLQHELDEHLRFGGVAVFDPHANAAYYCTERTHGVRRNEKEIDT